ncbi:Na+/H+ antiporter [Nocardioides marmoriginsengisoli]|uniref:Na+/H+ antiporter n=1 Tax=Nocardioides marmoriginsengisoli TaxID=661483 RepID=A0A3N0CFP8_9ACTN|nr:Na+/H+ antiporter [Nocardioides marmoriginsengisoli]RNL62290.1 Na+/H+ antiporter [Nocardioides marmoriginsengisoli]
MDLVVTLVSLVAAVLATTAVCARLNLSSPLTLIAVGIIGSFLPFIPDVELHPEVVLLGLLPPLLYAASLQTSLVDFNANRRSILLLSVGLVAFTTAGVGVLVHALLPDVGWAGAFAIGAVVAPPDAIAATAIGRRIGLPRRIVTILEGESLLNDATALVALRTALAAAIGVVTWQEIAEDFGRAAGGGLLIGLLFFVVIGYIRKHVTDPVFDSGLSFVTPFAAYVTAEEIHASGVISVVVAGLLLGHKAPIIQTAQSRIAERMNWRSIAFLLESSVFLLIGLQARTIITDAGDDDLSGGRIALICALTLVAVIVLRVVWVFAARYLIVRPSADGQTGQKPPWTYTLLLGWAGMRGVVTLAAAFIIPTSMPHREVLLLIAFTVTAGTLFLQGMTLPWLAKRLRVPSPDPTADALSRANLLHQASQAGLAALDCLDEEDPHEVSETIRERVRNRDYAAWERVGAAQAETPSEIYARRRQVMIEAERARVLEIRSTGTVAHEVVEEVLAMLDVEESMLDYSERERERVKASGTPIAFEGDCDDLRLPRPPVEPDTPGECGECVRMGSAWVHLRMCLVCGHIGCCDSSPQKHATGHFHSTGHEVMRSAEPGETWRWCFVHELTG